MDATTVNTVQAKKLLIDCIKSGLVPMLEGSPGVGKSSIVNQIAKEFNMQVIDMRLSQCDPTDLNGFPFMDVESGKAHYKPMATFPLETDPLPEDKKGWLLFLDEFNSAPISVQAAAYKLVLDRAVGNHKLHEKCVVICAGNKSTDNAIVSRMSTAMQSRLVHLELESDYKAWLNWASGANIDYRITSFINFKPEILNSFDPDHQDKTFACGRTWEFVSKLISNWPNKIPEDKRPLLSGTVSEGVSREFMVFCEIFTSLPTIAQITANPESIKVPDEPSVQYAISGSIGNHCDENNIDKLMLFINRLPMEFQVITLQDIMKRKLELSENTSVKKWITTNAKELF